MRMLTPTDADYDQARELFNQAIDKRPAIIAQCADAGDVADAISFARDNDYEIAVRAGGHSVSGLSSNDGGLVIDVRPIDKRPAIIAQCADAGDVADAIAYARDNDYEIAVRAGGHSVSGLSSNDGGLVIDVRPIDDISVDPARRSIRVGGGVTWGPFDAATAEHGLAVTGGRATSTGVAGYTLGGGDGWLSRAFGLACDNLRSLTLVTADGRVVRASESENPELFWALHGGGGNFGVVTEFEFGLHPLPDTIYAGLAAWPFESHAEQVTTAWRDFMVDAPDEVGTAVAVVTGPPEEFVPAHLVGQTLIALAVVYAGPADEGAAVMKPLMDLAPELNLVGPMPYTEFQIMLTDQPGFHHYWSADYHDEFTDEAVDVFLRSGGNRASAMTQQFLLRWGGAVGRVSDSDTPMSKRSSAWVTHPFGVWSDPREADGTVAWVKQFRQDIAPYTNGGVYLNFIGGEGQDRVRAAFGDANYRRLAAIKGEYDPDNIFRGNQNIHPA